MSDVANHCSITNCECSRSGSCRECQDLPDTPDQATEVPRFDLDDACSLFNDAHRLIWNGEDDSSLSNRLEVTFRTYDPENRLSRVTSCHRLGDRWMQYRCDLTGMHVAVPKGAPIPIVAVYQILDSGERSLARCFKIHPDYLSDRERLLEMLASELEDRVTEGLFKAREALSCLRFMEGRSSLPGVQGDGISYPCGKGYRALGKRPLSEKG